MKIFPRLLERGCGGDGDGGGEGSGDLLTPSNKKEGNLAPLGRSVVT